MRRFKDNLASRSNLPKASTKHVSDTHLYQILFNKYYQFHRTRLEKASAERLEKMKEEAFSKLKDLGNTILGNFGMSLNDFKATQDPQTGSWSIGYVHIIYTYYRIIHLGLCIDIILI